MAVQHLYLCDIQNVSRKLHLSDILFSLYCIHIVAIQITLAQLSYILNLIRGAKIDRKIEGKLNLACIDIVLSLHIHYIKKSNQLYIYIYIYISPRFF